ncbi:MAG TPA: acyl carrier protein [Myxococcales bacterium]|nr:acyl carrier protein [Myxococcales bacterium]
MDLNDEIRQVVGDHANLAVSVATLTDEADLYSNGMTSHASVNLMLALEERFDIEFPDRMLRRRAFESIAAIRAAIEELTAEKAA